MPVDFQRLHILLHKYNSQTCSEEELKELDDLLGLHWRSLNNNSEREGEIDWERMYHQIITTSKRPVIDLNRRRIGIIAAACLLGVLCFAGWLYKNSLGHKEPQTVAAKRDVLAPERNKATITLANGTTMDLANADTGTFATQENVQIRKMDDGQIAYTGNARSELYNTLHNPRGSRVVAITLADGTRAWLNAASSLSYPVAFITGKRRVQVEGEVYFEVAPDAGKPFVVTRGNTSIIVLGTHFNVNTFNDNGAPAKITLLQGSVKVIRGADSVILKPGGQAQVQGSTFTVVPDADLEQVMAWKSGLFNFEKADLKTVLADLSRWYDIDVVYEGDVAPRVFHGKMTRELTLTQVLDIMKEMDIKCRMEGRKLVVTQ